MSQEASLLNLTPDDLQALLRRAMRNTLILGILPAVALLIASGWRSAAMLVTGTLISAASLLEWRRLVRIIDEQVFQKKKNSGSAALAVFFFLFRLVFFGAAIYGSLKCFHGSPVALLCGLALAVVTLMYEGLRLVRG